MENILRFASENPAFVALAIIVIAILAVPIVWILQHLEHMALGAHMTDRQAERDAGVRVPAKPKEEELEVKNK